MAKLRERQTWRITFKQNCDVWYEISQDEFKSSVFRHIVDYPINKIELNEIDSIYPIYMSELTASKTLIEIKEYPKRINLKYTKKEFLKKESNSENKILLKYSENIHLEVSDDIAEFCLLIHSPYSYVSAIRKLSKSKFNNRFFEPGDLYPIFIKKSGTMEMDWTLEIIDVSAETNFDRKKQYLNDSTQKQTFHKLETNYNSSKLYNWINSIVDSFPSNSSRSRNVISSLPLLTEDILNGSCFYLSAGADITPIIALQDEIRTFIFCDEYASYGNSTRSIKDMWLIIDEKLQKQKFNKLGTLRVNKDSFKISDNHRSRLENISMSFWEKEKKAFCLIYFNWENSLAFHNLYVKNKIVPKAICEILPDGGSIGKHSMIQIPYIFRMPEYSIGHNYSVGKHEEYELISEDLEYLGEYGPEFGSNYGKNLYRRKGM